MDRPLRILLVLAILFPFAFLVLLSVGRQWVFPALWPEEWSLANWAEALASHGGLGATLGRSLGISLVVATVGTGLGFWSSQALTATRAGRWLLQLAYLPYIFAPVILAACLQYYFLVLDVVGQLNGVLLAQLFIAYPFAVILLSGFWNDRLRATQQLAATLGASPRQAYWRVLLPMARGPLLVCFFQTFLISWFEYGLTTLIGLGKVQTLTLAVFQYVNEANIFFAAVAGVLLAVPPVLMLWLNKRYIFIEKKIA
ncbi:MAG: hypothetical protein KDC54_12575 [Lewinella sp.]|nr:hypothetical protein [Lewinella sp.]